jgi:hypothetical protein
MLFDATNKDLVALKVWKVYTLLKFKKDTKYNIEIKIQMCYYIQCEIQTSCSRGWKIKILKPIYQT